MSADNVVIVQENIPTVTEKREDEDSGETQSIKVEGLALPFNEESRNGVKYTKESIKETKEQMIGCSVLWNHDADIPSLGKVVDTEIKEGEQGFEDGLYYTMELDTVGELESKVARKLEKGYISNVSIQAAVDDEGLEAPKVAVKDWYELTICNIAGFPQTTTDTSEQSADGQPAKVQLNGRTNMTEMALAESLDDDGDSQDDDDDGEENFAGLSDDVADRAEELVNEDNDLSFKESVLQAIEEADDSQDGSDGENENSNKNGDNESNSMSGDNSDSGDNGNENQEQPDDIEEMVEQMQETVNELADRVESVEEQVASMSEADDGDDKNQDDDDEDEDEGKSKQGFDPDDAQDAAESTRNQIAESLRETK